MLEVLFGFHNWRKILYLFLVWVGFALVLCVGLAGLGCPGLGWLTLSGLAWPCLAWFVWPGLTWPGLAWLGFACLHGLGFRLGFRIRVYGLGLVFRVGI